MSSLPGNFLNPSLVFSPLGAQPHQTPVSTLVSGTQRAAAVENPQPISHCLLWVRVAEHTALTASLQGVS